MIRLSIRIGTVAVLALACGSGESTPGGDTPPVSASGTQAAALPAPPHPDSAAAEANNEPDPQALGCLDLVSKGRFQAAIAPCLAAVKANPADRELSAALSKAQGQAKAMADAGAAAADASKAAGEAAVGDAMKGATDKLGY